MKTINILEKIAIQIVRKLQKSGYSAYFAGGCVRDILMKKTPADFDIATSAKPAEIEKLFSKTLSVGKQFGVMIVVDKKHHFEVATFRGEEKYSDNRRPDKIYWTSAKNDAQRRDFTINGIFYDPIAKKTIDYVVGRADIQNKLIRFIGSANSRICEDHLRILRAIRFNNQLSFSYETKTEKAILKNADLIKTVSKERIKKELDKILINKNRTKGILDLDKFGILKYILPEIEKMKGVEHPKHFHAEGDVFNHTILSVKKLPQNVSKEVAWATLLHDVGKPPTFKMRKNEKYGLRPTFYEHVPVGAKMTEKICQRLKFSKKEREKVVFLVREHLKHRDMQKMKLAKQRRLASHPWIQELMQVWKADGEASWVDQKNKVDLSLYNYARKIYKEELKRPKPKKPLLDGFEIMKIRKIKSGPQVGQILKKLIDAQLEEKVKTKNQAIEYIKKVVVK
jgi:poly(A) polymerase